MPKSLLCFPHRVKDCSTSNSSEVPKTPPKLSTSLPSQHNDSCYATAAALPPLGCQGWVLEHGAETPNNPSPLTRTALRLHQAQYKQLCQAIAHPAQGSPDGMLDFGRSTASTPARSSQQDYQGSACCPGSSSGCSITEEI